MVVPNPKAWLPDERPSAGDLRLDDTIGILAFEAAATMTRLVSLHRSLSDERVLWLRSEAMRSQGVAYLNSTDQAVLLRFACAEMMDDLDRSASAVTRLGFRCKKSLPREFDRIYAELKAGSADPRHAFKGLEKAVRKMERYVDATAKLHEEMEVLAELEAAERKLEQRWGRHSGPIPIQKTIPVPEQKDSIQQELKSQRQKVRRLKEGSLWGQAFDKAVGLMARAACAVFARVCVVFGPFVPGLPPVVVSGGRNQESSLLRFAPSRLKLKVYARFPGKHSSGPLERRVPKEVIIWNSCPIFGAGEKKVVGSWSKMLDPPASTVGGSGLAVRYANTVLLAEKLLLMRTEKVEERREVAAVREELYEMLPAGLRAAVRGKLRDWWRRDPGAVDGELAGGWKEAARRILGWLALMANDTVRWQAERNMDRRQRFDPRPRVLLLQTLHFSDREKTEAAIVEVLVGLSCVGWYERPLHLHDVVP